MWRPGESSLHANGSAKEHAGGFGNGQNACYRNRTIALCNDLLQSTDAQCSHDLLILWPASACRTVSTRIKGQRIKQSVEVNSCPTSMNTAGYVG